MFSPPWRNSVPASLTAPLPALAAQHWELYSYQPTSVRGQVNLHPLLVNLLLVGCNICTYKGLYCPTHCGCSAYLHDTFLIPLVRTWLSDTGVTIFAAAYNILWLLPAFIISVLVSWAWCGEIAEMAVLVAQRRVQRQKAEEQGVAIPLLKQVVQVQKRYAQTVIAENIYKPLLLGVFFLQAVLMGHIPKIGKLT